MIEDDDKDIKEDALNTFFGTFSRTASSTAKSILTLGPNIQVRRGQGNV